MLVLYIVAPFYATLLPVSRYMLHMCNVTLFYATLLFAFQIQYIYRWLNVYCTLRKTIGKDGTLSCTKFSLKLIKIKVFKFRSRM